MATKKERKRRTKVDTNGAAWTRAFLGRLALCGNIREAAQAAKVSRSNVYKRRDADATFAAAMAEALEDAADRLYQDARWRAKKSDKLLIFLLRWHGFEPTRRLQVSEGVQLRLVEEIVDAAQQDGEAAGR